MLKQLHIQNYAIIEEIVLSFSPGLNIITGETGAGKSIVMGALSLILGERAESGALMNRDRKCVVEGTFLVRGKAGIGEFLAQHDLDGGDELVIRREIAANGKSRAFINDTPVNLSQLQEVSSALVDLHQQFHTLDLGNRDFQRTVLDALAGNQEALRGYAAIFENLTGTRKLLENLAEQKRQAAREADYTQFLYDELAEASFRENELEEIDTELNMLNHSEGIKTTLSKSLFTLEESDEPLVQQLKSIINQLQVHAGHHPGLPSVIQRLQSAQIELRDIASELARLSDAVNIDPARIDRLNERSALGYRLLKKHNLHHTAELIALQKELEEKLRAATDIDERMTAAAAEVDVLVKRATDIASAISLARQRQSGPLEQQVNKLLARVGMPNARLKVQINQTTLQQYGKDDVAFLFDANKSGQFLPVARVASGGELSRLMLCIKSLVAERIDLPTMIFDEIDSGISGEAARQVGLILKDLAAQRQIICITHQPQIAGKADFHFFVYKQTAGEKVNTHVRMLSKEERITTIAQMLSGEKPTAAAMENAREMVMH